MLSRVANSIYWMSRYIERAENVSRFIDVNLRLILDLPQGSAEQWKPLILTTGDQDAFFKRYPTASRENVIRFLAFDDENPDSIRSCVRTARENARSVREIISSEMWECVNEFYLKINDPYAPAILEDQPHEFFSAIRKASHLFAGTMTATFSQGEGWHFARLGRLLERADQTSRILDVKYFILLPTVQDVGTPLDDLQWVAMLRSASAFEMYRKRHGRIAPQSVVDFLLLDREFPRGVHHCLIKGEESLRAISGTPPGTFRNPAEQRLGQLRAEFAYAQVGDVINSGLHEFLDGLQSRLNAVGDGIYDSFFATRPVI